MKRKKRQNERPAGSVPCLILLLVITLLLQACTEEGGVRRDPVKDSQELQALVREDQAIRNEDTADYEPVDKLHREVVMRMLADGQIRTARDKLSAALILQHTALIRMIFRRVTV